MIPLFWTESKWKLNENCSSENPGTLCFLVYFHLKETRNEYYTFCLLQLIMLRTRFRSYISYGELHQWNLYLNALFGCYNDSIACHKLCSPLNIPCTTGERRKSTNGNRILKVKTVFFVFLLFRVDDTACLNNVN